MATYTPNYSFKKPAQEDSFDIEDANQNMELLDTQLFALQNSIVHSATQEQLENLSQRVGTTDNIGGTTTAGTTMAKLNAILAQLDDQPKGAVKSMQRGVAFFPVEPANPVPIEIEIAPINPDRAFIILNGCASKGFGSTAAEGFPYVVSVSANSFYVGMSGDYYTLGAKFSWDWQVVEFY